MSTFFLKNTIIHIPLSINNTESYSSAIAIFEGTELGMIVTLSYTYPI